MSAAKSSTVPPVQGKPDRFASVKYGSGTTNKEYANAGEGLFTGPAPIDVYVETCFPKRILEEAEKANVTANFTKVVGEKVEKEHQMYRPFVRALDPIVPVDVEVYISADDKPNTSDHRPDIGIRVPHPGSNGTSRSSRSEIIDKKFDWINTTFAIEFKLKKCDDAFEDKFVSKVYFEKTTPASLSTRGQLMKYSDDQFIHQHRHFLFQLLICGRIARLLRWDRAGAFVSVGFDYIEHPEILAMIIWCLTRMSQEELGWDPTVSLATKGEEQTFTAAISKVLEDGKVQNGDGPGEAYAALRSYYPIYRVLVKSDLGARTFLIGGHFHAERGPFGRGTRAYLAYDPQALDVKLLKDGWAVSKPGSLSESDVYKTLRAHSVPAVLEATCGGAVENDGVAQTTSTQTLATSDSVWRAPCGYGRAHEHRRLVQPLAYGLASLKSTKELIMVARDVVNCIDHAQRAGILHRDISFANILFIRAEGVVKGILNDWDHACKIGDGEGEGVPFRSATWQFMAISLMVKPTKGSELIDDLESVFWVLLYAGIHYARQHDLAILYRNKFFNCGGRLLLTGDDLRDSGRRRRDALSDKELGELSFLCQRYQELVLDLALEWRTFHALRSAHVDLPGNAQFREQYEEARARMSDPSRLLAKLNATLQQVDGWSDNDFVADQIPFNTERQADDMAATLSHLQYKRSHLPKEKLKAYTKSAASRLERRMQAVRFRTTATAVTAGMKRQMNEESDDPNDLDYSEPKKKTKPSRCRTKPQ